MMAVRVGVTDPVYSCDLPECRERSATALSDWYRDAIAAVMTETGCTALEACAGAQLLTTTWPVEPVAPTMDDLETALGLSIAEWRALVDDTFGVPSGPGEVSNVGGP